jgi:cephalosporin hydroxylase
LRLEQLTLRRVREIGVPGYGDDEVEFLASVVARQRPDVIFEWGTNVGASARIFYEAVQVCGVRCAIHSVELLDEDSYLDRDHPGHRYAEWLEGIPVHLWRGDGLDWSILLLRDMVPKPVSVFYLDGNHEPGAVLRELEGIAGAAPAAVVVVHDTRVLTGETVLGFATAGRRYRVEHLPSDAGMMALWPT